MGWEVFGEFPSVGGEKFHGGGKKGVWPSEDWGKGLPLAYTYKGRGYHFFVS